VVPPARVVDPGGRDGCRAPLPWDASPDHGWPGEPWLPWSPDPGSRNVASLRGDDRSILHLYRRVLAARRYSPALRDGAWQALGVGPAEAVLAYERRQGDDRRAVLVNFTSVPAQVDLAGSWVVDVDSEGEAEGEGFAGRVGGDQAVVLRPAERAPSG